ncbi:hypothetical protein HK405_005186 [Cladochytrium tenue]|nr:hypothetical protein HK405_005186 [Cladochytrium tenue]
MAFYCVFANQTLAPPLSIVFERWKLVLVHLDDRTPPHTAPPQPPLSNTISTTASPELLRGPDRRCRSDAAPGADIFVASTVVPAAADPAADEASPIAPDANAAAGAAADLLHASRPKAVSPVFTRVHCLCPSRCAVGLLSGIINTTASKQTARPTTIGSDSSAGAPSGHAHASAAGRRHPPQSRRTRQLR